MLTHVLLRLPVVVILSVPVKIIIRLP